jgi:hypothetical protein
MALVIYGEGGKVLGRIVNDIANLLGSNRAAQGIADAAMRRNDNSVDAAYDDLKTFNNGYVSIGEEEPEPVGAGLASQIEAIELGFRYNPLERRNAHGEWTRGSSTRADSGIKYGGGKDYDRPPAERYKYPKTQKDPASENAFIKKYGLSAKNIVAAYDDATPAEKDQGMRWYADAHTVARMLGNGDADKGAALLSAFSPQTDWATDVINAAHAIDLGHAPAHGTGITGSVAAKANEILSRPDGSSYDDLFKGAEKTSAFYRLMKNGGDKPDDTQGDVVIDRHALSVAAGHRLTKDQTDTPSYADVRKEHPEFSEDEVKAYRSSLPPAPVGSAYSYQHIADMYREAAKIISERDGTPIAPHQLQAITWQRQIRKNDADENALVAKAMQIVSGGGKMGQVPGAQEAKGRATRMRNAWNAWGEYAKAHGIEVGEGTTAKTYDNASPFDELEDTWT